MRKSNSPILITLSFLFILAAADVSAQQVKIVHIDVGQGDSTLVIGPDRTLLFDAGVPGSGARIRNVLTSLGLNSVDFFVAGHYHNDHIGAIDEVVGGGISVNVASFDRGGSFGNPDFNSYVTAVGARRRTITLGERIDLGGGCVLTCVAVDGRTNRGNVSPLGENDRSIALILRFGTFDYLIASDLTGGGLTGGNPTADVESLVAAEVGDVDVLHVNHHGSSTSTNQTSVNTLRPEHAVISCGDGNTHRHPRQPVLSPTDGRPAVENDLADRARQRWDVVEGKGWGQHYVRDRRLDHYGDHERTFRDVHLLHGRRLGRRVSSPARPHGGSGCDQRGGVDGVEDKRCGRVDRASQHDERSRRSLGLAHPRRRRSAGVYVDGDNPGAWLFPHREEARSDERAGEPDARASQPDQRR